ncbi:phytanoyl-CoA dioxygenase family protein [Chloroflexi bacterium TSY]|nr:phytanoyl-CoA dioxygenase family protein [Chloroflexi bacterium TSY]
MNTIQPIQLTQDQLDQFHAEGFLIVHDLLTKREVADFLDHQAQPKPVEYQQGLQSHKADPKFAYVAKHPNVAGVAAQILQGMPRIVQTMYMRKDPAAEVGIGGAGVALHQDTHYLPSKPNTLIACWIAMSDTDPENGGLCVVPGSNHQPLRSTHLNEDDAEHASWEKVYLMRSKDGREWNQKMYSFQIDDLDEAQIVMLTVPGGSGVFFSGMTIHGSYANRSKDRERLAFAVHYVKDGTWLYRADVQDTEGVTSYSSLVQ